MVGGKLRSPNQTVLRWRGVVADRVELHGLLSLSSSAARGPGRAFLQEISTARVGQGAEAKPTHERRYCTSVGVKEGPPYAGELQ
jgi:hypothetical protein